MQKTFLHQKGAANSALLAHTVVKACNCCNASGLRHYCLLPWCSFLSSGPLPPASGAPPARESSTGKSLLSLGAACNNTMQSNVWLYQLNRVGDFYYSYEASRQDIGSQQWDQHELLLHCPDRKLFSWVTISRTATAAAFEQVFFPTRSKRSAA